MHSKRRLLVLIVGLLVVVLLVQAKSHPQADPCQNFYGVACGNWSAIHASDAYQSFLGQLDYNYQAKLADLLDAEGGHDEPHSVQQLRYFYTACRRPLTQDQVLRSLEQLIALEHIQFEEMTVGLTAAFRLQVLASINHYNKYDIFKQLLARREHWHPNTTNREPLTRQQFDELWVRMPKIPFPEKEDFWHQVSRLEAELTSIGIENDETARDELVSWIPSFWMLPWPKLTYRNLHRVTRLLALRTPQFMLTYIYLRLQLPPEGGVSKDTWLMDRDQCAEQSRQILSHAAVWLMEQHHPRLKEEPLLQDIFEELKQRFGQKLRANRNNFTRRTQQFLVRKLKRMRLRLSILPRNASATTVGQLIDGHYRHVHMNASDYFGNLYIGLNHSSPQMHEYGTFASPFYITEKNMLIVPLSLLEPPLYAHDQPPILTYSSLGFILGHELSHGFDSEGVTFSADGVASRAVDRETARNPRFQHELSCLDRRFGSRRYEKFADASGLELAYSAYFDTAQTDRKRHRSTDNLLSQQQQFFHNFAQFFCSDGEFSEESDHGSDRKRVNDAVAHFKPFREAFSCGTSHKRRRQCRLF
ncbi:phosphate-regulating neutral endopeptidase PHEX isoform X2 [Drosophila teissieri]|uniref:phosphate-regulating neutral endopeptidase PHEX isoform X2 n=1 Tax=Drosophila teissieri TaxID=7243 RepID=UPI001CBA1373|nr:phosphate-regulating neutral endopeptidase PHEX isoform X2 [Drosophila teissieri]